MDDAPVPGEGVPWARLRWWLVPAVAGLALFLAAAVERYDCRTGRCAPAPLPRLLDLDAIGSLPRLSTTALFLAGTLVAGQLARRSADRHRTWWAAVAAGSLLLAVAKLVSVHSEAETSDGRTITLVGSLLVAVLGLALLHRAARRWQVPGSGPVLAALAAYAAAAIGLDAVTHLVTVLQAYAGLRSDVLATFVEEFGEFLTALLLLGVLSGRLDQVRRPADPVAGPR